MGAWRHRRESVRRTIVHPEQQFLVLSATVTFSQRIFPQSQEERQSPLAGQVLPPSHLEECFSIGGGVRGL